MGWLREEADRRGMPFHEFAGTQLVRLAIQRDQADRLKRIRAKQVPAKRGQKEIWVVGYPSTVGGADTELDHQIDLWRRFDVQVNLVPLAPPSREMRRLCDERGCITHDYHPALFKDKVVVSFCNGDFLKRLPSIHRYRPRAVVWFNCMTWVFENELKAVEAGLIDYAGFVSNYQRGLLAPKLGVKELPYVPYFNPDNRMQRLCQAAPPAGSFCMGRISRADPCKFSNDMWSIFADVRSPRPTKTFIAGWGIEVERRVGAAPSGLDWQIWEPGHRDITPVSKFYSRLHCLIHKTGGSRESYCRAVVEAMASGVPVIVENDFAFPELIDHGRTGFLCGSSEEMSAYASQLAQDEGLRLTIAANARRHLFENLASPAKCWAGWKEIL